MTAVAISLAAVVGLTACGGSSAVSTGRLVGFKAPACQLTIGLGGMRPSTVKQLRRSLTSNRDIRAVRFLSAASVRQSVGIPSSARTGPVEAEFDFTARSVLDMPSIAAALRRFGPIGAAQSCSLLQLPSAKYTVGQVEAAFAARGLEISPISAGELASGSVGTTTVETGGSLAAESWQEIDEPLARENGATYFRSSDGASFHVLVFREVSPAISRNLADPEQIDIERGNVFVRDTGMTAELRSRVLRAIEGL